MGGCCAASPTRSGKLFSLFFGAAENDANEDDDDVVALWPNRAAAGGAPVVALRRRAPRDGMFDGGAAPVALRRRAALEDMVVLGDFCVSMDSSNLWAVVEQKNLNFNDLRWWLGCADLCRPCLFVVALFVFPR